MSGTSNGKRPKSLLEREDEPEQLTMTASEFFAQYMGEGVSLTKENGKYVARKPCSSQDYASYGHCLCNKCLVRDFDAVRALIHLSQI